MIKKFIPIALMFSFVILNNAANTAPKKAPGFALVNNKGKFVFKSRIKGNLIISFWASYCSPCLREMPVLINFEDKYKKSKNLTLVLINVDNSKGASARLKAEKALQDIGLKHDFLIDQYHVAFKKYNPGKNVPATFLINKKGFIVFKETGAHKNTLPKLEKAILKLRK